MRVAGLLAPNRSAQPQGAQGTMLWAETALEVHWPAIAQVVDPYPWAKFDADGQRPNHGLLVAYQRPFRPLAFLCHR